jgi:N-acetylmuramoyl-L-alanine amidase
MKRGNYPSAQRTTRRMKKRMLKDILEENLFIHGLSQRKTRFSKGRALFFKSAVLFVALFSFTIYKNSDPGDYHTLPALPLSRYMTIFPDSPPGRPFAFYKEKAGGNWGDYQPLLNQKDFSLRTIFGLKIRTLVIDPGHGGEDPGTSGELGTREKDITLDIARRLQQRLSRYDGYDILLTRTEDKTLSLEDRIEFANGHGADLYVSIHVNNIPDKPYSIIETYYFGPNSDRDVLSLAEKENSGSPYSVGDFKVMLQKINNTLKYQEAKVLARAIQRNLFDNMHRSDDQVYDYGVKMAPFIVLLGVDMPSVLTEVTCLSDPREEKKLQGEAYREDIARCLEEGIVQYLQIKNNPTQSEV